MYRLQPVLVVAFFSPILLIVLLLERPTILGVQRPSSIEQLSVIPVGSSASQQSTTAVTSIDVDIETVGKVKGHSVYCHVDH